MSDVELRRLLAEPAKWQGVDRRGAWIASTEDGERVYVRDVILGLLDRLTAEDEDDLDDDVIDLRTGNRLPPEYMCPNCVTPWKCNGPHIPQSAGPPEIGGGT